MKLGRHKGVEVSCEYCGNLFIALVQRVKQGMGRFCSRDCYNAWQRKEKELTIWGRKDLATVYKVGSRYTARWYDENGNIKSSSFARWWWEMNVGEIPQGMIILHRDNNPMNIDPSNFELGTKSQALVRGNETRKKNPKSWKHYIEKLRVKSTGRKHTEEAKQKLSIAHKNLPKLSGKNHPRWRGGQNKEYPKEFYQIRAFVIERDNSRCQICSRVLSKNQHVHHRDGNRNNNDQDNLLTLCASCHGKVHSNSNMESLPIMALRAELSWNK